MPDASSEFDVDFLSTTGWQRHASKRSKQILNSGFCTDPTGTTQYIWDYENRLRQVIKPDGTSVNYKYNALGQRTERFIGANSTKFTYDGDDVILDINSDGSFVKYINGPRIDNKIRQTINGQAQYFIQDHFGSTNALTDAAGNIVSSATYDAFGKGPEAPMRESMRRTESTGGLLKPGGAHFFPASRTREAFINEQLLMMQFGGPKSFDGSSKTYNLIFSPGKKYGGF